MVGCYTIIGFAGEGRYCSCSTSSIHHLKEKGEEHALFNELPLTERQMLLLKRLIEIERIYEKIDEIENDLTAAFG